MRKVVKMVLIFIVARTIFSLLFLAEITFLRDFTYESFTKQEQFLFGIIGFTFALTSTWIFSDD